MDLRCLNYALIVLILRKEGASMINEFWPISFLNTVIKIITKVLANRLRLTFISLSIKPNRPLRGIDTFLIMWFVRMRFLRLHTTPLLKQCSLSLILKRHLIPLIETSSLSYS